MDVRTEILSNPLSCLGIAKYCFRYKKIAIPEHQRPLSSGVAKVFLLAFCINIQDFGLLDQIIEWATQSLITCNKTNNKHSW